MDGEHQALFELLLALVLVEIELVEAGVCSGQALRATVALLDCEPLLPGNAKHVAKSTQWYLGCPCITPLLSATTKRIDIISFQQLLQHTTVWKQPFGLQIMRETDTWQQP